MEGGPQSSRGSGLGPAGLTSQAWAWKADGAVPSLLPEPNGPVGRFLCDVSLRGVGYEGLPEWLEMPPAPGETVLFLNTGLYPTGIQRGRRGANLLSCPPLRQP